ncbi:MAG: ATP-grasp domain-containing protein [Planctomycetota bacterium]
MKVLVLAGGPDAEHDVSLASARAVAEALAPRHDVELFEFRTIDAATLGDLAGDVVFPILHGPWGEGGPMQELLERDGRPYLGSRPRAARFAMDKLATKRAVVDVASPVAGPLNAAVPPELPCVIKPNGEGSSVGLFVVRTLDDWHAALTKIDRDETAGRSWMFEAFLPGPELTVPLFDRGSGLEPLPVVRIDPAAGTYDYAAKYERSDTRYTVDPPLGSSVTDTLASSALAVARAVGVRHLARVDFMLDSAGMPSLLEINTMPGFTATSLLPMSAAAVGLSMPDLADHLAGLVLADNDAPGPPRPHGVSSAHEA